MVKLQVAHGLLDNKMGILSPPIPQKGNWVSKAPDRMPSASNSITKLLDRILKLSVLNLRSKFKNIQLKGSIYYSIMYTQTYKVGSEPKVSRGRPLGYGMILPLFIHLY